LKALNFWVSHPSRMKTKASEAEDAEVVEVTDPKLKPEAAVKLADVKVENLSSTTTISQLYEQLKHVFEGQSQVPASLLFRFN